MVIAFGGAALAGLLVLDQRAARIAVDTSGARARSRRVYRRSVCYGPHGSKNSLEIWQGDSPATSPRRPVILQVPGGGYVRAGSGRRSYPVLQEMANRGWLAVSLTYRPAPAHQWPAPINDVSRAIGWVRDNIEEFGGDPDFIAVVGSSAGAHLAALVALAAEHPRVQAVVASYGVYDWRPPAAWPDLLDYLRRSRVAPRYDRHTASTFAEASPICHVRADAPPFLVLHGTNDVFIPVAQARAFVHQLRSVGADVQYVELDGAQHAFDMRFGQRTPATAATIAAFLERTRASAAVSPRAGRTN